MEGANSFSGFLLVVAVAFLLCFPVSIESKGKKKRGTWCMAKPTSEKERLQLNIDYSCKQPGVDCWPIQLGGSCFNPNTTASHASYAMNLYYKVAGKHYWDCYFNATAMVVSTDPSYGTCVYPL